MNLSPKYKVAMLVDDNELDNFINKKLIESEAFAEKVLTHVSAQSALEELKRFSGDLSSLPEIVFLDIMMPHMDGFGFLEEFDKLPADTKKKCRIVMLSTSESFKDLNKANQDKNVFKFLNKPLNKAVLDAINI